MSRSRTASLIAGALSGWIGHFIGLVCTFILTPLIITGLGTVGYGVWSLIATITSYYGLADLGIGVATTKYLSQHLESGKTEKVCQTLKSSSVTYLWLAPPIIVVAIVVGALVPIFVDLQATSHFFFFLSAVLLGANASFLLLGTVFRSYLRAKRAFSWINFLGIATQIVTAIAIGWIVTHDGGIVQMATALFAIGLCRLVFVIWIATYQFDFPWKAMMRQKKSKNTELFRLGALVVAARAVSKLSQKVGTLGAVAVGGPAIVAFYSIAETVCEKAMATMVPVRQMIVPTSSALSGSSNPKARQRFLVLAPRMFLAMGLGMALGILLFGQTFLELWIGLEFATRSWPILAVLAIAIPLRTFGGCLGLLLQGAGKAGVVAKIAVFEGVLLVSLIVGLCLAFGEIGLAWSVVLSTFVTGGLLMPFQVVKTSEIKPGSYYIKVFGPAVVTGLAAWLVAWALQFLNQPSNYTELLLHGMVFAAVGALSAFFFCADQTLRDMIKNNIKRRLRPLMQSRLFKGTAQVEE